MCWMFGRAESLDDDAPIYFNVHFIRPFKLSEMQTEHADNANSEPLHISVGWQSFGQKAFAESHIYSRRA